MTVAVTTPFLGVNDSEAVLVGWLQAAGTQVKPGDDICALETTKATLEVQAEASGYLFPVIDEAKTVKVDQVIGFIAETADFDAAAHMAQLAAEAPVDNKPTRKAELLMARHGLDLDTLADFAKGAKINEEIVQSFLQRQTLQSRRIGAAPLTRVAIIGGVSGGGALIIADALHRIPGMQATCIYDRDPSFKDQSILGVPVVGPADSLAADRAEGRFDQLVIAFNRNLEERHRVFTELKEEGHSFANVIDPSADLRLQVTLGEGNVILGNVYLGACTEVGDNNFISANVALEHGNILGSSCAFGPGVFTSGNVSIGDRVRFGTGIFIEPGITVGDDAVIGSGQSILTNIRAGATLTSRVRA